MSIHFSSDSMSIPYFDRVARGMVPGASVVRKYGLVTVDSGTGFRSCWEYGSVSLGNIDYTYTADGSATVDTMSSYSGSDTQEIVIEGVDGTGAFVSQTKSLNGQNKVTLDTPLNTPFRAYNNGATSTPLIGAGLAGVVYIYEDTAIVTGVPTDKTKVKTYVGTGQQTLQSFYTIPLGYTGYVRWGREAIQKKLAATAAVEIWTRPFGKAFRLSDSNGIDAQGSSSINETIIIPDPQAERTSIMALVDGDTNGTKINIRFDILLVENA